MSRWYEWLGGHTTLLAGLGVVSVLMFLGTLIAIPILVARIPADYFVGRSRHRSELRRMHPARYVLVLILKNLLGVLLIVAGIAMLVLPGQGILTILMGVFLTDFPGKFRFERWLISRPGVYEAVNWMRRKVGEGPILRP